MAGTYSSNDPHIRNNFIEHALHGLLTKNSYESCVYSIKVLEASMSLFSLCSGARLRIEPLAIDPLKQHLPKSMHIRRNSNPGNVHCNTNLSPIPYGSFELSSNSSSLNSPERDIRKKIRRDFATVMTLLSSANGLMKNCVASSCAVLHNFGFLRTQKLLPLIHRN